MSDNEDEVNIEALLESMTSLSNPEFDVALEQMAPVLKIIAAIRAKMELCGIPPALADTLTLQWCRTLPGGFFNAPFAVFMYPQIGLPE